MKLTLREALKIEPLTRAQVIAGISGLDNIVSSVNIMEVPDILNWVHPEELLVTTLYPLRSENAQIEKLIPALSKKGLSGLAVKFNRYVLPFPPKILDIANKLAFPILELPDDISFVDIIQSVITRILDLKTKELERSITIHNQFIDLMLRGGGFPEIANSLINMIEHPVTIIDQFGKILANSILLGQNPQGEFIDQDELDESKLHNNNDPKFIGNLNHQENINLRVIGKSGPIDLIVYPILISSKILGKIIVWNINPEYSDPMDIIAIENCAAIVALKLMEIRTIHQIEQRFSDEILIGLLSDQRNLQEKSIQKAFQLGYKLSSPFLVLFIQTDIEKKRLNTFNEYENDERTLYRAKKRIQLLNPNTVFWLQGSKMIVFYPINNEKSQPIQNVIEKIIKDLQSISIMLSKQDALNTVSIGISSVENNLLDFHRSYDYARQSYEMGHVLSKQKDGVITYFNDLGILRLVSINDGRSEIEKVCFDLLGPLISYDKKHGTELLNTLNIYLENHQNASTSAKQLMIHYNTLRYRLDCIDKMLSNALKIPQKRIAIEFALQIYPLVFDKQKNEIK